ncbi:hypothetical protein HWI79_2519 [Cryptosporidium felis]|nr:hypothetical protein HWI79_2519 [Cryptosporidium felis]
MRLFCLFSLTFASLWLFPGLILGSERLKTLIEEEKSFKIPLDENEYERISDLEWKGFTPEKRCQLIIEKLDNDVKKTASTAKENLIVYTILRPIPVDDSGACFKRIILWHFEKVELVKSDKNIINYEDIIPVRFLLLGMSPKQIEKEPRDLAEIPGFLEIACKKLLSQKPRMRWPLAGARYHPFISNILGFQKAWIYRVSELLSTCAQHTYQSSNGYLIMLLVSAEHMVDDEIFGDFRNAWKGRYGEKEKFEFIFNMDENKFGSNHVPKSKEKGQIIDFEVPEGSDKIKVPSDKDVDIEVIRGPSKNNEVVYSPDKLPVYEIPNSVTSEICIEVGTKEIPGRSRYKQLYSQDTKSSFHSVVVPPNGVVTNQKYTVIRPEDRVNINLSEYKKFWMRPNYVNKYRNNNSLQRYLEDQTHLYWPEASEEFLDLERERLSNSHLQDVESFDVHPNLELTINPKGGEQLDKLQYSDEEPLVQPFQLSDMDSFDYSSTEYNPEVQKFAYYDSNELPEEERGEGIYDSYNYFSSPIQGGRRELLDRDYPALRIDFQGMTGRKIRKQPFSGADGDDSLTQEGDFQEGQMNGAGEEEDSIPYYKFRDIARNAVVRWYIDDEKNGDSRLTGKDRRVIKKLFSFIDEIDPDHYSELINRGEDYIVRKVLRIGKARDPHFQEILDARKGRSGVDNNQFGVYSERRFPTSILKSKSKNRKRSKRRANRRSSGKGKRKKDQGLSLSDSNFSRSESGEESEISEIPKNLFIKDTLEEKYDFQNILKKERLKRLHKLLKDAITERMNKIEKKDKTLTSTKSVEILKTSVVSEQKNREKLENEYKKNLEEHAKILDLLKKNQVKLREKMEEEHRLKEEDLKREMKESTGEMEAALESASAAVKEIEKEKNFLDERLKGLEVDNKHIRALINMKDNYIKKIEKNRFELESKQAMEMKEMKESYERQLSELKKNLSKDDTITGLNSMLNNLEFEAKKNLERIEENTLNEEKISRTIDQRLKDREKQLELAYQKQKKRDSEYLNYVLQILESKDSNEAKRVVEELKSKILELEEKQEELQHTREELEMINNDLVQTVEEQNKGLAELMKKVEDLRIEKKKAQDELNLANIKLEDISMVEKRLKEQLEEVKRSGAPSEEILRHLQKSLKVAENERKLATEVLRNAQENLGSSENNMKIAMEKLEQMKRSCGDQKEFEKKLREEVERRVKSNQRALKMSAQGESDQGELLMASEIRPLNKKELEELDRLRSLGLDELSDEDKKRLLMLGQRQLATMELSVVSTFGDLNNQVSKVLNNEEIERSKVLLGLASDSSANRMEVENSLGEILLEKIEGQEQSLNNMRNLLEETQNTISELNKQLIIQRELSEEANNQRERSFVISSNSKRPPMEEEEGPNNVFEEISNDIIVPGSDNEMLKNSNYFEDQFSTKIESPPMIESSSSINDGQRDDQASGLKFTNELRKRLEEINEKSGSSNSELETKQDLEAEVKQGENLETSLLPPPPSTPEPDMEESFEKDEKRKRNGGPNSSLGRKERVHTPISFQRTVHDLGVYDSKKTMVANTEYEANVNKHNHPDLSSSSCSGDLYLLHDAQEDRPPSSEITCEGTINAIRRSLDSFSQSYGTENPVSAGNNKFEVMTRTVLPGMQYDECYNSTMLTFEHFQERMIDKGVFVRVFVLLTDFMDTLMIGDISRTGYLLSNVPPVVYRVLGDIIEGQTGGVKPTIETVISNFPSEWIHEHTRTCKDILSGKSLESITKAKGVSSPNLFSPVLSPSSYSASTNKYYSSGLKTLPPLFLANIEVLPRPDREPCIRIIKRIKQRISEVNGLLMKKRELQEKLKIKDPQEKLFVFTFEDKLPYDFSSPATSHYCEKYLSELFIKMNNMEWRAKPKNNSLVRLITVPTSEIEDLQSRDMRNDLSQVNLEDWRREALRLAFDPEITSDFMGNSLVEYLTNKRLIRNSNYFFTKDLAKELIIKLLDTINLKDSVSKEILLQNGWGRAAVESSTPTNGPGLLGRIFNGGGENSQLENTSAAAGKGEFKAIPGIILIVRTSDVIPRNTQINPLLLSLKPDESPYLIETIRETSKTAEQE